MKTRPIAIVGAAVLLGSQWVAVSGQLVPSRDTRIDGLLDQVSAERLQVIAERLASFETRHTLSTPEQAERGIGAARQWILDEMASYSPRLRVSFDTYQVPAAGRITRDVELRNVMAVLPGRSERRVYVSGHYDTVVLRPSPEDSAGLGMNDNYAPGANDDGSGTALTMELARVFGQSGLEFDATLVFIALAGEEMGLVGARVHAQKAAADNVRIDAVLNNDIIGNSRGGNGTLDAASVRVFSEGPEDSPSRQLARYVKRIASMYVPSHEIRLIAREDRFGRGGDHTAFNQNGFPGVRLSESKENYARQHTVLDTPDGMDFEYLAKNARVNAAAAAGIALAPPQPVVLRALFPMVGRGDGYDAQLRWEASAGAIGYRVFWREAWGPDWQHEVYVGDVLEYTLEGVSIDDFVFGVAAVGPDGIESIVSAYERPPRANVPVRAGGGS
ncbi:MAG TPA: M20/M25/M40 family metallo-hydrolase [Longimicrobiales bacterium]|nr:M20/M25/M40 family metallo-hydrolase [Longimicrobiales bacterium]